MDVSFEEEESKLIKMELQLMKAEFLKYKSLILEYWDVFA